MRASWPAKFLATGQQSKGIDGLTVLADFKVQLHGIGTAAALLGDFLPG